jgi:hypothetical protein
VTWVLVLTFSLFGLGDVSGSMIIRGFASQQACAMFAGGAIPEMHEEGISEVILCSGPVTPQTRAPGLSQGGRGATAQLG